jgi:DNA processing protein
MPEPDPAVRSRERSIAADACARAPVPDLDAAARLLAGLGVRLVRRGDGDYPASLLDLPDPPPALFVRGTLPEKARAVAVVGSRAATPYGVEQATRLAADLADLGFGVVSGLARGIDAAAHRGALEAGGVTVAVLPGALDDIVPSDHRALAERIAERGAWLSEIVPGASITRGHFVRRNRLIAALTSATVVVQAAAKSGALVTAGWARRLGRPLFAVPGDVDRFESRGCHALIQSGAGLCECAGDVVRALPKSAGEGVEARLLAALGRAPRALEEVARAASVDLEQTLAALLRLEWNGLARSFPGQRWGRVEPRA